MATGFILIDDLPALLFDLGLPLGWDTSFKGDTTRQTTFIDMVTDSMKTFYEKTKYSFHDTLDNLILVFVISKEL